MNMPIRSFALCDTPDERSGPKLQFGTIFIGIGYIAAKI